MRVCHVMEDHDDVNKDGLGSPPDHAGPTGDYYPSDSDILLIIIRHSGPELSSSSFPMINTVNENFSSSRPHRYPVSLILLRHKLWPFIIISLMYHHSFFSPVVGDSTWETTIHPSAHYECLTRKSPAVPSLLSSFLSWFLHWLSWNSRLYMMMRRQKLIHGTEKKWDEREREGREGREG